MAVPKNKDELLSASKGNFDRLNNLIDSFPERIVNTEFSPGTLNRNIRDVLAHLHHWHLLMLEWYQTGMNGAIPAMPSKGYSWKELPQLNAAIRALYSDHKLSEIRELMKGSHREVMDIIVRHTDEELFEKKRYHWTGSTSLAVYLRASTSSHYHWAVKLITKATRPTKSGKKE